MFCWKKSILFCVPRVLLAVSRHTAEGGCATRWSLHPGQVGYKHSCCSYFDIKGFISPLQGWSELGCGLWATAKKSEKGVKGVKGVAMRFFLV